jgi:hypothetical protein
MYTSKNTTILNLASKSALTYFRIQNTRFIQKVLFKSLYYEDDLSTIAQGSIDTFSLFPVLYPRHANTFFDFGAKLKTISSVIIMLLDASIHCKLLS